MRLNRTLRRRLRVLSGPAVAVFLVAYFIYHMVEGNHGLIARDRLSAEVDEARITLQQLEAERMRLEGRADRLQRRELDLDLLDERARVMLNLAGPNDLVLPFDDGD